jgi:hypothetical protein
VSGEENTMETITNEEIAKLEACKSEREWNKVCDEVKAAHGGYPSDWWPKVMQSGLCARVTAKFGKTDGITIESILA